MYQNVFGPTAKQCRVTAIWHRITHSWKAASRNPARPTSSSYKIINRAIKPGNNLPNIYFVGELIGVIEGSANGKLVIDLTMHHLADSDADRPHRRRAARGLRVARAFRAIIRDPWR
jgi:hypothetical protein